MSGVDAGEIESFRKTAFDWWKPGGAHAALHAIAPVRLAYIREQIVQHFHRNARSLCPFDGLALADIGCGGGLLCEPLARLGAAVTGIDPVPESIEAARIHAEPQRLNIRYLTGSAEDLAQKGETFDAVVSMEVIEHVPDPQAFIRACAACVKPGGLLIVSTINRTLRSYALAIIGAEYILRWLPMGTHSWEKFITPEELEAAFRSAGLMPAGERGCIFNPLGGGWQFSSDTAVNYFATAVKAAEV